MVVVEECVRTAVRVVVAEHVLAVLHARVPVRDRVVLLNVIIYMWDMV